MMSISPIQIKHSYPSFTNSYIYNQIVEILADNPALKNNGLKQKFVRGVHRKKPLRFYNRISEYISSDNKSLALYCSGEPLSLSKYPFFYRYAIVTQTLHKAPYHLYFPNIIDSFLPHKFNPLHSLSSERFEKTVALEDLGRPVRAFAPESADWLQRLDRCCIVTSHLRPVRLSIIQHVSRYLPVDVFLTSYSEHSETLRNCTNINIVNCKVKDKSKINLKYKYALVPENTLIDGYITEKVPEALMTGCIPIYTGQNNNSTILNRCSYLDFRNIDCINSSDSINIFTKVFSETKPLLDYKPKVRELYSYLANFLSAERFI